VRAKRRRGDDERRLLWILCRCGGFSLLIQPIDRAILELLPLVLVCWKLSLNRAARPKTRKGEVEGTKNKSGMENNNRKGSAAPPGGRIRHRASSPPRVSSPSSMMMSLSTVHGSFNSASSSPEGSPRSASSWSSLGGRPPVVSPSSPTSSNNSSSAISSEQEMKPRMTVSELETVHSSVAAVLPPSQQPHHPSYSFRRVHSLPASPSNAAGQRNAAAPLAASSPSCATTSFSDPAPIYEHLNQQDASSGIMKLLHAVQHNTALPAGLTLEEKALWDAVQVSKRQARQEALHQTTDNILNSSHQSDSSWESRFTQIQEQAKLQQRDNSRSLRAIQRVLADVQAQRDEAVLQLQDFCSHSSSNLPPSGADSCTTASCSSSDPERESMQRDLKAMSARIVALERELRRTPSPSTIGPLVPVDSCATTEDEEEDDDDEEDEHEPSTGVDDPVLPSLEIDQLEQENKELRQELDWKENEIRNLKLELAESKDVTCLNALRKELEEKSSALENAKMIIGSLENASGSLASDLRAKMKRRDDDISRLQKEATENKKTMDKLATELKNLQKKKAETSVSSKRSTEAEQVKRLQLSSRLETNMAEIFAASVVLESTQDATAVANLSELLTDSISALKEGIDTIENGCSGDERLPARLWKELEEKRKTVKRFEESLDKQVQEMKRFRAKVETAERKHDEEVHNLHAEIRILRQQCDTNMEVLTRKERELTVLRDSLMVGDDAAVGYISDDEEEDDDDGKHDMSVPTSPIPAEYGPSQAEALATLLAAHGGNRSFDSDSRNEEQLSKNLQVVKAELNKTRVDYDKVKRELKVQKESLSNAKMIISSLERANKSMMEDLRARLQDSNTAIASLLEKSLESEKTCGALRNELETLKRAQSMQQAEEEEMALALPPSPHPLLLTETID